MVPSRAFPLSLSLSLSSPLSHSATAHSRNETRGAHQNCVIMFARAFPKAKKKKTKKKRTKRKERQKVKTFLLIKLEEIFIETKKQRRKGPNKYY